MKRVFWISASVLLVAIVALTACGPQATPTPETITIIETVEKVVEKEGETVTVIETVETVVTATPEPTASPYDENAPIEVWVDAARMPEAEAWVAAHPDEANLVNFTQADRGQMANQILLWNNIDEGWPDVVFGEPRFVALWADAAHDWTADLTPWVPQEVIDNYGDNLSACRYDGRLTCLRHDLAQIGLWYDQVVLDELGIGIPETMEDYLALAQQVAADHPDEGYVMGSIEQGVESIFRASQCPLQHEVDLGHIQIFDPADPACVRAAEMMDAMWATGVFVNNSYSGDLYGKLGSKVAFIQHASWYGQHIIFPNFPEDLRADGRIGYAKLPKFEDTDDNWTGAWGGSAWSMSRHSKNPQLAIEVLTWMAAGPWNGTDATTFPAYPPENKIWGAALAEDPFYVENPFPTMVEMAPKIWTGITEGRMYVDMWSSFSELVLNPVVSGEMTAVEALPVWSERLTQLAGPLGFEVVD
jgi:ABC-type glycerol-3-phosphate transport system substrate-binding protein